MTLSQGPQGREWAEVVDVLHSLTNVVTVRSHYAEGHPAIARADELTAGQLQRLLAHLPEVVFALIDDELVVCERPMPDLRDRISVLADAMLRHEVECIVVQRGITVGECTILGRTLAAPRAEPGRAQEQARAQLTHVGFRFAERRAKGSADRGVHGAQDFVPAVHGVLGEVARAIAGRTLADLASVRAVAAELVACCEKRAFLLQQRCHVEGGSADAAHAVNVAMMAAAMALDAGLETHDCVEIAAAALLHDIGHLFMPQAMRGVPEPLLDVEGKRLFRHHPYVGASALLGAGCPPLWVAAALEHHRGVDGKGYPTLRVPEAPHERVRMVALANFVDRRRTLLAGAVDAADEALYRAVSLEDVYFGRATVEHFVRALGVFPPGTTVRLSDRSDAIVVAANPGDARRPVVRMLTGPREGERADLKQLDGVEDRHLLSIVCAIAPPILVRPPDAPGSVPRQEPPAPALASLRPLVGAVSMPPAARVSGTYSSVKRPSDPAASTRPPSSSQPPAVRSAAPPPILSSAPPPAGASAAELERSYLQTLGSMEAIPRLAVAPAQLGKLGLDHRAGFVLTFVDGVSSIETILDASGLPRLELLRMLRELVQAGAVVVQ